MKLPGAPVNAQLRCPACGWGFELGLRRISEWQVEDGASDQRAVTTCSKCLTDLDFRLNAQGASDVRVLTEQELAKLPPELAAVVRHGHFLAWLAQQMSKGPLQ